jgi:hypothetical protein
MKRLIALLTLLPLLCAAQTKTPIQLLSPTGSTAGQAIVSTGPSTAPQWSTPGLASIGGNTVLGNFTASSVAPTANAMPSCSTANSALKYTTSSGLSCGTTFALTSGNLSQFASTTSAQLLGVLSDETGTGVAVFGTSPTITTPNIVGTATNNNANAGSVGEVVANQATGVSLTTSVSANITTISLTAGDWDVEGNVDYVPAGGTSISQCVSSVNTTSATQPASPFKSIGNYTAGAGNGQTQWAPITRLSLASTTTVYLVGFANFGGSTLTANGFIRARRIR